MHITYTQYDQSVGVATSPESHKDQNEPHQTWDNGNQHQSAMDLIKMWEGAGVTSKKLFKSTVKMNKMNRCLKKRLEKPHTERYKNFKSFTSEWNKLLLEVREETLPNLKGQFYYAQLIVVECSKLALRLLSVSL